MNRILRIVIPLFRFLAEAVSTRAATLYVDLNNPTPAAPYLTWTYAATNIQDAIDAATAGDLVLLTNRVYAGGGRVVYGAMTKRVVDKGIVARSVVEHRKSDGSQLQQTHAETEPSGSFVRQSLRHHK